MSGFKNSRLDRQRLDQPCVGANFKSPRLPSTQLSFGSVGVEPEMINLWRDSVEQSNEMSSRKPAYDFFSPPGRTSVVLGAALYILIAEGAPQRFAVHRPATAGLLLLLIHKFMGQRLTVSSSGGSMSFYKINGIDKLVIYGNHPL